MNFDMNYDDKHHRIHKFLGKLRLKNVSQSDEVKGDGFERLKLTNIKGRGDFNE